MFTFRRLGDPDPERFLAEIRAAQLGMRYTKMDRYRDFRRVFLESEQGKRVLYEILSFCGMYRSAAPSAKFDPYETMFLNGHQDIGFRMLATMNSEPTDRQEKK